VTSLPRLQGADELLDDPDHDPGVLEGSLKQIAGVNRWLGGRRALIRHLGEWIEGGARKILDVGTGCGDLPMAVRDWGERRGVKVEITAVDAHPQIASLAARRTGMPVAVSDGLHLPFRDDSFDVALLSMTLHHFDGAAQLRMLGEMARVASQHLLVNELHRSWPNYLGSKLLAATLWRGNHLTRHDGPISVLRAFTPGELVSLAKESGLVRPRVYRHFFFRLVLTAEL